jgi:hypothetical protein
MITRLKSRGKRGVRDEFNKQSLEHDGTALEVDEDGDLRQQTEVDKSRVSALGSRANYLVILVRPRRPLRLWLRAGLQPHDVNCGFNSNVKYQNSL